MVQDSGIHLLLLAFQKILSSGLPDNFTQLAVFLDKVILEVYKKPNQQILSIFKRKLHLEL